MLWIPYALFSAIILASRRTYEKHLTNSFGNFSLGFIIQAFSLIPTLALFPFFPLPNDIVHLPWQFWWPLLIIWLVLYPVQTYFLYRGLREGELSHVTQVAALLPVFNMISSYLLLGEIPTIPVLFGIMIIVFGTYLLLTDGKTNTKGSRYNKAVLYTIIATLCVALGSTLDKISIAASTPVFYSFMNTLGATMVFMILIYVYKQHDDLPKMKIMIWPLIVLGIFQTLSFTAKTFAFSLGPTSYVLALLSSSFLFAAFLGIILMKEPLTRKKLSSLGFFIAGILLITVVS